MNWPRLCVAVAALAAFGCRPAAERGAPIDPALAALAPADTVMVAGLRLEALRATPVWQKHVAGKPVAPLDQMAKDTGLDVRKDVSEVLLASDGKDSVVLAKGKFAQAEVEAAIEKRGGKRMPYKGIPLTGNEEAVVAFLDATTVVAGRASVVRSVIDQRGRSGAPKALLDEARGVAAGNQVWAVSVGGFDELKKGFRPPDDLANLARIAAMVEKSSFGADLRSGLNATATLLCRTEEDARTLFDAARGIIGLARLSTPDNEPDLLRFYDGIQVALDQRSVRIRAEISQELLDKALERLPAGGVALSPGFSLPRRP